MLSHSVARENTKITRAEKVRLLLVDEIVGGKLSPGMHLDEVEQAKRFGVSRTPVREAFRELAALGLVENRPHRGVIVASPPSEPVKDLAQAFAELLVLCGELAGGAVLAGPDGDDDDFVGVIAAASGNAVLRDTVNGLWVRLRPFLPSDFRLAEAMQAFHRAEVAEAARLIRAALHFD